LLKKIEEIGKEYMNIYSIIRYIEIIFKMDY